MISGQMSPNNSFESGLAVPGGLPTAARLALRVMQRLSVGSLSITLPDGTPIRVGKGEPHAEMTLNNWNVASAALRSGDIGFGETYIAGDWTTPNLQALMRVMVSNRSAIEAVIYGKWWGKMLNRLRHLVNHNSRAGSRRNIAAHYDIGNSFYQLWLDPTMTYSSGLFAGQAVGADDAAALDLAQHEKYQRILAQLDLAPGARVLEIGCGWGGFAEQALRADLCVTGITLSREQLDYAQQRLSRVEADGRVQLRLQDYRDANEQFDGIASIEMFEAVGEQYWPGYFAALARSLKPGGRAVVQTITIDDALFADYRRGTDFIQQYIFPGGMLPSPKVFREAAQKAGLIVRNEFAFGADYAQTLAIWHSNFRTREREVRALGFDTAFIRTWAFYLAYCEAAFRCGNTDVIQFTLERVR